MPPQIDFPYYNGQPVNINGQQWLIILGSVLVGFLCLIFGPIYLKGPILGFIPIFLFLFIPLFVLRKITAHKLNTLFKKVRFKDVLYMIGFAILNIMVTFLVGYLLVTYTNTTSNPAIASISEQTTLDIVLFFIKAIPQLIGEEIMSILPFLAFLYLFHGKLNCIRKLAIFLAIIGTSIVFAAAHLDTYDWNIVQTIGGVGVARIVLLLPYLLTKNVWVSSGTHILNDWIIFGVSLLGSGAAEG